MKDWAVQLLKTPDGLNSSFAKYLIFLISASPPLKKEKKERKKKKHTELPWVAGA